MKNLTEKQKYELGLNIIAGMKANAYDVNFETGMAYALQETRDEEASSEKHLEWIKKNRKRLHSQALYIADVAINALNNINK